MAIIIMMTPDGMHITTTVWMTTVTGMNIASIMRSFFGTNITATGMSAGISAYSFELISRLAMGPLWHHLLPLGRRI